MTWIQTTSGRKFDLANPEPEMVDLYDIAHALSNLCRFTGHVSQFDSVAQHSFEVSYLTTPETALQGLLHDATEAYVADLNSPLKRMLPQYQEIEHKVWKAIAERFYVPVELDPAVKQADLVSLLWEKRDLLGPPPEAWQDTGVEHLVPVTLYRPQPSEQALKDFLNRFYELNGSVQ